MPLPVVKAVGGEGGRRKRYVELKYFMHTIHVQGAWLGCCSQNDQRQAET